MEKYLRFLVNTINLTILTILLSFFAVNTAFADDKAAANVKPRILQTAIYQIYAGGINAVTAKLAMIKTEDDYSVAVTAFTRGFLGWMVPWEGTFETHGYETTEFKDARQPRMHQSSTSWDNEVERKTYTYKTNGEFESLVIQVDDKKAKTQKVDAELTKDSLDILTATLNVLDSVASGGPCQGSDEIFDGKRRYKIMFNDMGQQQLEHTRYNVFDGKAEECTVEVKPIAGAWHKKPRGWLSIQEQGRAKGTMPTLWVAKENKATDETFALPVKLRVKTQYGTLFMHMTDYQEAEIANADDVDVAAVSKERPKDD